MHCCDILDRKVVKNGLFSAIFNIIKISLVTSFWSQQQENSTDKRPGYGSIGIPIQCRLALLLLQAIQQIVRKVQSKRTSYQRAQMYNLHVMYMYIDQYMYLSWDFRVFQDYIVKQFMTSKVNEFKVDLLSFYCSVLLSEVVRFVNYVNLPVRLINGINLIYFIAILVVNTTTQHHYRVFGTQFFLLIGYRQQSVCMSDTGMYFYF